MGDISRVSRRETLMEQERAEAPALPLLAIRGYLCFRCLKHQDSLRRCAGCHRAAYCSARCQRLDWAMAHKGMCKALQKVNEFEKADPAEKKSWEEHTKRMLIESEMAKANAKKLSQNQIAELAMIVNAQSYCAGSSCHLTGYQLSCRSIALENTCKTCNLVSFCSRCPSSHTEAQCRHYKLIGDLEQYRIQRFDGGDDVSVVEPIAEPFAMESYAPLSAFHTWTDFFTNIPVMGQQQMHAFDERLHFVQATDSTTMSLTILAALEASISDLVNKKHITVHLVGAASREQRHLILFEDILHLLPGLKHLHIVFCGPNTQYAVGYDTGDLDQDIAMDCCPPCMKMDRKRTTAFYPGMYHDYVHRPAYTKPDLAVLFHSGRSQEARESWKPTTKFLVDSKTRTVCTTYTLQEATEEVAELDDMGIKFIVRPEENKWRGLGPLPELLEGEEHSAYFLNYYWYIFEGKTT